MESEKLRLAFFDLLQFMKWNEMNDGRKKFDHDREYSLQTLVSAVYRYGGSQAKIKFKTPNT